MSDELVAANAAWEKWNRLYCYPAGGATYRIFLAGWQASTEHTAAEVGFHVRNRLAVEAVLDEALGTEPDDELGTGNGMAADVHVLMRQRDEARTENESLSDRLAAAEKERDELAESAQNPLRNDHPAIVHAEKTGYDRGWTDGISENRNVTDWLDAQVTEIARERDRWKSKAEDFEGRYETCHASHMNAETQFFRVEAERDDLRDRLAAIEALADEMDEAVKNAPMFDGIGLRMDTATVAQRIRAAVLSSPDTPAQAEKEGE